MSKKMFKRLGELHKQISECTECELYKLPVNKLDAKKGYGKLPPRYEGREIMFVGMNASNKRDPATLRIYDDPPESTKAGRKFVDTLGRFGLLNRAYFTNLLKCSSKDNKVDEKYLKKCTEWLELEIQTVHPKIIVPMGKDATEFFLGERGVFGSYRGIHVFPIYHPNYVFDYNIKLIPTLEAELTMIFQFINRDFPPMVVLFEGADKTGKTSIEAEFIKLTNYRCITLGRSAMSGMVYDVYYNRDAMKYFSGWDLHQMFLDKIADMPSLLVHCFAAENELKRRAKGTRDEKLNFKLITQIYRAMIEEVGEQQQLTKGYEALRFLELNTTDTTPSQAAIILINAILDHKLFRRRK